MANPGWYPDQRDPSLRRYFDGQRWTEHLADAAGRPVSAAPAQPPPQPQWGQAGWAAAPAAAPRPSDDGLSPIGLAVALAGALVLLLGMFVLPWFSGGGQDVSLLDAREAFRDTGPDVGIPALAFVTAGAFFLAVAGISIAVVKAVGLRAVGLAGMVLLLLGGLLGTVFSIDAAGGGDGGGGAGISAGGDGDSGGSGSPSPAPVPDEFGSSDTVPPGAGTVPPGADTVPPGAGTVPPSDSDSTFTESSSDAEDRLLLAAISTGVGMVVVLVLAAISFVVRGGVGRALAGTALGLLALWAVIGVLVLNDKSNDTMAAGAWVTVVGAVVLLAGALIPGPRRTA